MSSPSSYWLPADNVFILVHELDRQNQMHGPNTLGFSAISPTSTVQRAQVESKREVKYQICASLSIGRGTCREDFGRDGTVDPAEHCHGNSMPAVRNYALYAAGSVLLNTFLQVIVFVNSLALDLRRAEDNRG